MRCETVFKAGRKDAGCSLCAYLFTCSEPKIPSAWEHFLIYILELDLPLVSPVISKMTVNDYLMISVDQLSQVVGFTALSPGPADPIPASR